ncbi:MAG: hypothetical protein JWL62_1018 [Hyphomicrobiales bacterium]|nr:hypothetical protein [Hyphomicrobiales bacterium]
MPHIGFETATIKSEALQPSPIRPEWIISGTPAARAVDLARSPDGTCFSVQWDCTKGTFHWYFGIEETVHILEGEVLVRDGTGRETLLRAGDVAVFSTDTWMVWHVETYVRKLAICRFPVSRGFGRVLRLLQNTRTKLRLLPFFSGLKVLPIGAPSSEVLISPVR